MPHEKAKDNPAVNNCRRLLVVLSSAVDTEGVTLDGEDRFTLVADDGDG